MPFLVKEKEVDHAMEACLPARAALEDALMPSPLTAKEAAEEAASAAAEAAAAVLPSPAHPKLPILLFAFAR